MFARDNTGSYNWFDASWRDNGFNYIYRCGIAFIGIIAAVMSVKRNTNADSFRGLFGGGDGESVTKVE
jgi:hypothetical protein